MAMSKTSPRRVVALERAQKVLELRRQGKLLREIADELGITKGTVHKILTQSMRQARERLAEDATVMLQLELERLDAMQYAIWDKATQGHLGAIDRVLKIMERRAKLLGLDKAEPTMQPEPRIEIIMPGGNDEEHRSEA